MKYNFIVDDGDRAGSKVDIERDGLPWKQRDGTDAKNYVDMEFQHEYVLTFSKPGFITKKIAVSTVVPKKKLDEPFDPLLFNVTIFRQYEGVNIVVFNNPVARYAYQVKKGVFEYDTDYSKTIIAEVKKAEDELKVKHKADKSSGGTPPVRVAESKAAGSDEKSIKKDVVAEKNKVEESPKKNTANSGTAIVKTEKPIVVNKKPIVIEKKPIVIEKKPIVVDKKTNVVNKPAANVIADMDSRSSLFAGASVMDDNHIEREYVAGNKHVTETIVTRGGRKYIYKKVVYAWGVYYFRDNVSITEPTYIQEVL